MPEEIVQVEILPKVRLFHMGTTDYLPGDKLMIPTSLFRGDFMRKIPSATPEKPVMTESTSIPVPEPKFTMEKKGKKSSVS